MKRGAAWAIWAICLLALVAGLYGRFAGLGARPLAIDEYYFVKSVESVVEHGVPSLAGGGYYMRGLLPQYLTAASVLLLGENGLAYRLPSVLFSLATLGLAYNYARRFVGAPAAAAVAASLAVSSWQIEFARFARMYAPFQCLTLLFLVAMDEAFFRRRGRWPYAPHGILIFATITHRLGMLLTPLLFLPLATRRLRARFPTRARLIEFAGVGAWTLMLCVGLEIVDFRNWGVTARFPADYVHQSIANGSTFRPPGILLWGIGGSVWTALSSAGLLTAATLGVLAVLRLRGRQVRTEDLLLVLALAGAATHLLLPTAACLAVLVFRFRILHKPGVQPARTWLLLGATAVAAGAWLLVVVVAPERFFADAGSLHPLEFARRALFGWPDIFNPLILPWWREFPRLTILLFLAFAVQLLVAARQPVEAILRSPTTVAIYIALCLGLLQSTYTSSRYALFVYPVVLTVLAMSVQQVLQTVTARRSDRAGRAQSLAVALIYMGLFAVAGDFHPSHIRHVASEAVTFRLGAFEPYAATWYVREDYPGAAEIVVDRAASGDKIVVVDQPAVSYYLDREHAVYYDWRSARYRNVSRNRGTVDLWSGLPLVSTPKELRSYTREARVVWLVQSASPSRQRFQVRDVWQQRVEAIRRVGESRDGRLEVLRVDLRPAEDR